MASLEHFELIGSRGLYRPVGVMTFEQAVDQVAVGIEHARALGLSDLMVNVAGLSGFPVPTTFGRYAFAVRWAEAAGGAVRVALVGRPELIDREKIGVIMARNRGLDADAFTTEADALKWLDARAVTRR